MSGTLISSIAWVPRGRSALQPKKYTLDEAELERVGKLGGPGVLEQLKAQMAEAEAQDSDDEDGEGEGEEWEDEEESGEEDGSADEETPANGAAADGMDIDMDAKDEQPKASDPSDLSAFKMDEYDDEEGGGVAMGAFANVKGLAFYRDNDDDPYITLKNAEADEEEEREELALVPEDNMIITARTTSDLSSLDFHVFNEPDENLYVHHDLMLPSFPLCVEWLDFPGPSSSSSSNNGFGSYVAVGTFDPSIEIWDCDLVDGLYPQAILGPSPHLEKPEAKPKGTGKKKRREIVQPAANAEHHVQPVLALSWSQYHRNLLLSGSADGTIKLWDLTRESPMPATKSWDKVHGGEKVQGVEWNKGQQAQAAGLDKAILSAGWDRVVKVWDSRSVNDGIGISMGADVECVRWDPWQPHSFFVSLENGLILSYDSRTLPSSVTSTKKSSQKISTAQPKYTLSAHDGGAAALDINPHIRGCIATGGMDKTVKVWNVSDEETEESAGRKREISLATSRDLGVVFTARWCPDAESPLTLAAAGSKASLQIWDVASNPGARAAFGARLRRHGRELGEVKGSGGVVGIADEADEEDD